MAVATRDANSEIVYRTEYDRDHDGSISSAVVEALAAVENVEPENLDVRLYDSVESDALDELYRATAERSEHLRVAFTLGSYEVVLEDGGQIVVRTRGDARRQVPR